MYFSAGRVWWAGSSRRTAWCCHSYQARFRTAIREMAASRIVWGRVVLVRMARRKEFLCDWDQLVVIVVVVGRFSGSGY